MDLDRPSNDDTALSRRTLLRSAAGTLVIGTGIATATTASAHGEGHTDCTCKTCWVDVKPGSDPNGINPKNRGVVSVAAGWPRFEEGSVWLAPLDAVTNGSVPSCEEIQSFLEDPSGAQPLRKSVEHTDVDDDRDLDTVFKFRTAEIGLDAEDTGLVLVGIDSDDGCPIWGMDGVKVPRGAEKPAGGRNAASRNEK